MSITVTLKSGKKVTHDADLYGVQRDGSLHLYKRQRAPKTEPRKWWQSGPHFPLPPFPPSVVHAYASGEWKEFH